MPTPVETTSKINSFADLPVGWHYGEGVPASRGMVKKALSLHAELANAGFKRTNAFPGVDGQIMVTAYRGDVYHEFSLELDGTVNYVLEVGDEEVDYKENLSLTEAQEIARESANSVWVILESSITPTSMRTGATSKVMPLGTLLTVAESPSSMRTVPFVQALTFAPTSAVFTLHRPTCPRSFGEFVTEFYPMGVAPYSRIAQPAMNVITTFKDSLTGRRKESSSLPRQMNLEFA